MHVNLCQVLHRSYRLNLCYCLPPSGTWCMPVKHHWGAVSGCEGGRIQWWMQMFSSFHVHFFFLSCLWCSELFHSWSFVLGTALFACLFPFLFRLLFPLWFPHPPPRVTKPVCTISLVSTASPPSPARDVVTPHYNTVCCVLHSRVAGSVLTAERWPPPGMQATDFDF